MFFSVVGDPMDETSTPRVVRLDQDRDVSGEWFLRLFGCIGRHARITAGGKDRIEGPLRDNFFPSSATGRKGRVRGAENGEVNMEFSLNGMVADYCSQ